MVQLVQQAQGLPQDRDRGLAAASRAAGVGEVDERLGLAGAVADLLEQAGGSLVAVRGLEVIAKMVVGVAERVPGVGLAAAVTKLPLQDEGLLAPHQRLVVVAEQGVVPAHVVQGASLPGLVARLVEQGQRLAVVTETLGDLAEVDVTAGLANPVTEADVEPECLGHVAAGILPGAQGEAGPAE